MLQKKLTTIGYTSIIAIITGVLVAIFLYLLDIVTAIRWQNEWLIYLLPFAGIIIVYTYERWGGNAIQGNSILIAQIKKPTTLVINALMAPLVLLGTLITHLFGGSAGREGTAVQIGGGLADIVCRKIQLNILDRPLLLQAGMAAGFSAVFGTPLAGIVFAIELNSIKKVNITLLVNCIIASFLANGVCQILDIHHTNYAIHFTQKIIHTYLPISVDFVLLYKAVIAGVAFGIAALIFIQLQNNLKKISAQYLPYWWLKPFIGGTLVIIGCLILGNYNYIGIGVTSPDLKGVSIVQSFNENAVHSYSWFLKLLFTVVTLSSGFKGGEVTPLFFIGACLGNTLSSVLHTPVDLWAALGFIAVFAGATKTPFAATILGIELFGIEFVVYYLIVCFIAAFVSGKKGIYSSL